MTDIAPPHRSAFESIRHEDGGAEYWPARELASVVGCGKYNNFIQEVRKARVACVQARLVEAHHFADVRKMEEIGSGARRKVADVRLPTPDTSISSLERARANAIKRPKGEAG